MLMTNSNWLVTRIEWNSLAYLPISKYDMKTLQGERVERHTWDRFDGTDYTYEVFEEKKDGQMKVFRLY